MDILEVRLDSFEGPLDLLLHLIRKNQMDIYDIEISKITSQYLEVIEKMKALDLDIAGDFLVMAATLLQIKSRLLLPLADPEEEEEEEDPRAELVRRLLEYQRYKDAADRFRDLPQIGRDFFLRGSPEENGEAEDPLQFEEGNVYLLLEAFGRLLKEAPEEIVHQVMQDRISVTQRITEVLELLRDRELVAFRDLFPDGAGKSALVVTLLAMLELVKMKMVTISQTHRFGDIWIRPVFDLANDPAIDLSEETLGYQ